VKGRLALDHQGLITGLASAGDEEFTKIKLKESFIDLLYGEDQETFSKILNQCLKNNSPSEAWVRLNFQDENSTWLRMELCPKKDSLHLKTMGDRQFYSDDQQIIFGITDCP